MGGLRTASPINRAEHASERRVEPGLPGLPSAARGFSPSGGAGGRWLRGQEHRIYLRASVKSVEKVLQMLTRRECLHALEAGMASVLAESEAGGAAGAEAGRPNVV